MNNQLNDFELKNIQGGAIRWAIIGGISAIGILLAGIIDGYLRPLSCKR